MIKSSNNRQYDLEERTYEFAKQVKILVKQLHRTVASIEDQKQLVRSSGSVGANYIEANEALSKKDLKHRIMICRKEAKESRYWLRLLETDPSTNVAKDKILLIQEATELMSIFGAILRKV